MVLNKCIVLYAPSLRRARPQNKRNSSLWGGLNWNTKSFRDVSYRQRTPARTCRICPNYERARSDRKWEDPQEDNWTELMLSQFHKWRRQARRESETKVHPSTIMQNHLIPLPSTSVSKPLRALQPNSPMNWLRRKEIIIAELMSKDFQLCIPTLVTPFKVWAVIHDAATHYILQRIFILRRIITKVEKINPNTLGFELPYDGILKLHHLRIGGQSVRT